MKRLIGFLLIFILVNCNYSDPVVEIRTDVGNIQVRLYRRAAPVTVENFLRYVDGTRFEGATFYRTVTLNNQPNNDIKIQVIQGGLWDEEKMGTTITHETTDNTGVLHKNGVISMARNEPGSATSEFFICVGDQPELDFGGKRNPDGQGFAAFGMVVSGFDIVKLIHSSPVEGQMLTPRINIKEIVRIR